MEDFYIKKINDSSKRKISTQRRERMEELARHLSFKIIFYWEFKSRINTKFCRYQLLYMWRIENDKDGEKVFLKVLWLIKNVFLSHMHALHQSLLVFTEESRFWLLSIIFFCLDSVLLLFYVKIIWWNYPGFIWINKYSPGFFWCFHRSTIYFNK